MEKEGIDADFLVQIINSVEQAERVLEESHRSGNELRFNQAKRFILELQKRLEEELE